MKSLSFLERVDHNRKAAIYAAADDGKLRNFAYHEELGECRETFSRLLGAVQEGEIGMIMTPDAASLTIETSGVIIIRSEEHTSELQSLRHLVCRLLL